MMVPDHERPTLTLIDQQQALTAYLDALFREMPVPSLGQVAVDEALVDVSTPSTPDPAVSLLAPGGKVVPPMDIGVRLQAPPELPACLPEPVMHPVNVAVRTGFAVPSAPFQALFFTMAGLRLAIPLDRLDGIVKWIAPTPIPKMPAWHLGLVKYQGVTVNVVNAARFIIPPARLHDMACSDYQYILLIGGKRWGLGCDSITNVVTLAPEQVKWHNSASGPRPWLAGTVIEQVCALINMEGLITCFHEKK